MKSTATEVKFTPIREKCSDDNGKLCPLYEEKYDYCILEENWRLKDQVKPLSGCKNPNLTRRTKSPQNPRSNFSKHIGREAEPNRIEDKTSCVTHKCACGCGLPRAERSKYAHKTHRDHLRNKCRIIAYRELLNV